MILYHAKLQMESNLGFQWKLTQQTQNKTEINHFINMRNKHGILPTVKKKHSPLGNSINSRKKYVVQIYCSCLVLVMINLCIKSEVSVFMHYCKGIM